MKKYNQLIEFYQGTERKDQVEIAKKEIQTALEISAKMKFYRDLDFNQWEQNEIIKETLNDIKYCEYFENIKLNFHSIVGLI